MFPVIVSERWLPFAPAGVRPRDMAVLLSAAALLAAGALAPALLTGVGEITRPLHELTHGNGSFQCPLCGGTRAFAACCSLDFGSAFGLNPFAVVVFLWAAIQVPLRSLALVPCKGDRVKAICDRMDGTGEKAFLPLLFASWVGKWLFLLCFPG